MAKIIIKKKIFSKNFREPSLCSSSTKNHSFQQSRVSPFFDRLLLLLSGSERTTPYPVYLFRYCHKGSLWAQSVVYRQFDFAIPLEFSIGGSDFNIKLKKCAGRKAEIQIQCHYRHPLKMSSYRFVRNQITANVFDTHFHFQTNISSR